MGMLVMSRPHAALVPGGTPLALHRRMTTIQRNLEAQPITGQRAAESQPFGAITKLGLGLTDHARVTSVDALNRLLADTIALRDLYKKHHWQVAGPTFYELHRLFDDHAEQQTKIADALAERIQMLGGVAVPAA